jgi:DNA recombination-dependent growth factor C
LGIFSGSVTYTKLRVEEKLPRDFHDTVTRQLARYAFREINPKTNPESSIGWVNPFDPLDSSLSMEKVLHGKYLLLTLRRDKKTLSGPLVNARISQAIRAHMREQRKRSLSKAEQASLRETVKAELLAQVSASTSLFEVAWNFEAGEVFFGSRSAPAIDLLLDLFQNTFSLSLVPVTVADKTEKINPDVDFATLEPGQFT